MTKLISIKELKIIIQDLKKKAKYYKEQIQRYEERDLELLKNSLKSRLKNEEN